jgi:hypothetical protein
MSVKLKNDTLNVLCHCGRSVAALSLYIADLNSSRLPRYARNDKKQTPMDTHRSSEKTK